MCPVGTMTLLTPSPVLPSWYIRNECCSAQEHLIGLDVDENPTHHFLHPARLPMLGTNSDIVPYSEFLSAFDGPRCRLPSTWTILRKGLHRHPHDAAMAARQRA